MSSASLLLGISFDARTSMGIGATAATPAGYYSGINAGVLPLIDPLWSDFPIASVRYPANSVNQNWNWKGSIGAQGTRTAQQIVGTGTPAQTLVFGFDEFMHLMAQRGVASIDIQIMVNIYPSTAAPDAAQSAADWVEYSNSINNGTNPGGGTDWAAVRAANGHPNPYGIKIWNIGNEPWSPGEYNFDADAYLTTAMPIINAMLSIDSSLFITLPAVGSASSLWNATLINSPLIVGKAYGISPHFFYDNVPTMPGSSPGVDSAETSLKSLIQIATGQNLKTIIGDHAHAIPTSTSGAPLGNPDLAMQWVGAITTLDFLLMASQVVGVERANFWVYGLTSSVWHPIRLNSDSTYTLMPVASLYKVLSNYFLSRSLKVTSQSPNSGDGTAYSIRASAFESNDQSQLTVVAVNRNKSNQENLTLNGFSGYTLINALILKAENVTSEAYTTDAISQTASGYYEMPALSVLLLKFSKP